MDQLLLLPGMLSDAAFWRAQVEALADVAHPAVMSYGAADRIETMAEAVLADAPARFALAGHSMGGRVAQEICRRAPGRVVKLGLFCTDYRGRRADEEEDAGMDALLARARSEGMASAGRAWARRILGARALGEEAIVAAVVAMAARQSPEHLAAQISAGRTRPDYADLLPAIACPTLVCAGAEDTLRPPALQREMAAMIPTRRLVVIEGSGHMIAMENPEAVTAAMRSWLS